MRVVHKKGPIFFVYKGLTKGSRIRHTLTQLQPMNLIEKVHLFADRQFWLAPCKRGAEKRAFNPLNEALAMDNPTLQSCSLLHLFCRGACLCFFFSKGTSFPIKWIGQKVQELSLYHTTCLFNQLCKSRISGSEATPLRIAPAAAPWVAPWAAPWAARP